MLTLEQVVIRQGQFALHADIIIPQAAHVAVMGASGTGKSTLLLAIAGFVALETGHIAWDGGDLAQLPAAQRPVGMLFQDQNLFPHLTLLQNAILGLTAGKRATAQHKHMAHEALSRVGLAGMENRKPAQVSGGQAARAALARMLLQERPIWLLDEPFAALDEVLRGEMLDLTAKVATQIGATVLLVTHQSQDAAQFAHSVIHIADGVVQPLVQTAAYLTRTK